MAPSSWDAGDTCKRAQHSLWHMVSTRCLLTIVTPPSMLPQYHRVHSLPRTLRPRAPFSHGVHPPAPLRCQHACSEPQQKQAGDPTCKKHPGVTQTHDFRLYPLLLARPHKLSSSVLTTVSIISTSRRTFFPFSSISITYLPGNLPLSLGSQKGNSDSDTEWQKEEDPQESKSETL